MGERDDGCSAPIRSATSPSPVVVSQNGPRAEAAKRGKTRSCLVLLSLARDVAILLPPGDTQFLRYRLRVLEALENEHLDHLARSNETLREAQQVSQEAWKRLGNATHRSAAAEETLDVHDLISCPRSQDAIS